MTRSAIHVRSAATRTAPQPHAPAPTGRRLSLGRANQALQTDEVRRKRTTQGASSATTTRGGAASAASALSRPGATLPSSLRAYFEPRFGRDLSAVRLHLDASAGAAAERIDARAYTLGPDIAFAPGQFAPDTVEGRRLIAHELAHVTQNEPAPVLRRQPFGARGPEPFRDPRGPGLRSTLPHREATRLNDCVTRLGEQNAVFCRHEILGEPLPTPRFRAVPGVTSPVPYEATDRPLGGAAAMIGRVTVTFLPDRQVLNPDRRNRADTDFNFVPFAIGNIRTRGGLVTSFTGPAPPSVTIQTTYGPGATPIRTAGYGRGTTAEDIAAGETSVAFHEGRHGVNYIDFLEQNPYPVFGGYRQQPIADFSAEMNAYRRAVAQYNTDMARDTLLATDCVGTSIDTYNANNGLITARCVQP